jgi:hypothetical protein
MKITIDLRSAAIGLVAGVVLMFTLGASSESAENRSPRFQVAGTSFHAVIIDTTNGEAWTAHLPEHGGTPIGPFMSPKTGKK